jgi:hypothetical protein
MRRVFLFITAALLCGVGGMFGSIAGHGVADDPGLIAGGVVGVLITSALTGWIAAAAKWITVEQRSRTIVWTSIGSVLASLIATHTLSSPIGPILSTVLAGFGALYGSRPGASPG